MRTQPEFLWISLLFALVVFQPSAYAQGLKSDTIHVSHYQLNMDIRNFSAQILKGEARLTITPKMNGITFIPLDFLGLNVDSVLFNNQRIFGISRSGPNLRIQLPSPVGTSNTVNLRIFYHGTPIVEPAGWGGFHFKSYIAYNLGIAFQADPHNYGRVWFPGVDDFIDRATYEYQIKTETDKMAVCGGQFISVTTNPDNTKTWIWRMNQTIPAYLASVAVSNYQQLNDVFNGMNGAIPIMLHFRPGDTLAANTLFTNLKQILSIFENRWGPYSFDRVGYCGTIQGAMEHASNIAYPTTTLSSSYEWLYAHELAHMWFGDKITCSSAEDMWINEGWAVFNESIFKEGLYGTEAYRSNMNSKLKSVLQYCHIEDGSYLALYGIPNEYTYGETVYQKGGIICHTLRNYLGDSLFFPAITDFLTDFAFSPVSSIQLRDYLTQKTGINMTSFFDGWVFSPGFPGYVVDSFSYIQNGSNYTTNVSMHQKLKGATSFWNANKVWLTFMAADFSTEKRLMQFDGEYGTQSFTLPFIPVSVFADFDDLISDATTDYSFNINTSGNYDFSNTYFYMSASQVPSPTFVRTTHYWVAPDPLKVAKPGLKLSNYRYWKIDGIMPEGFVAQGRFFYSKSSRLDDSLFAKPGDSLVMLYRANAAQEWQSIPFTRIGLQTGYIYVENLKKGEYTLASWDELYVSITTPKPEIKSMHIYPNPSDGPVIINLSNTDKGFLKIYSIGGILLKNHELSKGKQSITLRKSNLPPGTYILIQEDSYGSPLARERLIITASSH
ncbi:MAG: M1 family aminopeptidase [Bacteroidales bacterium]|jgi:aminopeptidase N|nr:M1 family aminopeptidase [Bacteroidales bacterium]